jgi:hypothetical protein
VTAAPPRQARGQRPPAPWSRAARLGPFAKPDGPSRALAAVRPPGYSSLRIAPAETRSYSGLIRLISHTVVENELYSTRLRDD